MLYFLAENPTTSIACMQNQARCQLLCINNSTCASSVAIPAPASCHIAITFRGVGLLSFILRHYPSHSHCTHAPNRILLRFLYFLRQKAHRMLDNHKLCRACAHSSEINLRSQHLILPTSTSSWHKPWKLRFLSRPWIFFFQSLSHKDNKKEEPKEEVNNKKKSHLSLLLTLW
jgi:hypothetical protein